MHHQHPSAQPHRAAISTGQQQQTPPTGSHRLSSGVCAGGGGNTVRSIIHPERRERTGGATSTSLSRSQNIRINEVGEDLYEHKVQPLCNTAKATTAAGFRGREILPLAGSTAEWITAQGLLPPKKAEAAEHYLSDKLLLSQSSCPLQPSCAQQPWLGSVSKPVPLKPGCCEQ